MQLVDSLKEGGRGGSPGLKRQLLRRGLVVAEIALVLPLLVASGLAALAGYRFVNGPQGYNPDRLLVMRAVLPESRFPDDGSKERFIRAALERLKAIAGVERVTAANTLPASSNNSFRSVEVEGQPIVDPANPPQVDHRAVSAGYFETLGIPLIKGRGLLDSDRADTERVVVISESMAEKFWPGTYPIGRRVRILDREVGQWMTVVGIVGNHIHEWFNRRNYPTLFRPYVQSPTDYVAIAVRTTGDPTLLTSQARAAIKAVDPAQPMFDVMSMRQQLSDRTIGLQYITVIMAVFGGIALVLAIVGVYGVMAYLISQRTHEIGVRIALGASSADVLRLTVGQAWRLTAVGVAFGLLLAAALSRLIEAGLLGVVPTDARMLAGFAAVLVMAALVAGYVPARRATVIDPVIALREE
jgi:putative ABC transport system permease protein